MSHGTRVFQVLVFVLFMLFGLTMLFFAFGITLVDEDPVNGQVIALLAIGGMLGAVATAALGRPSGPGPQAAPPAHPQQRGHPSQYGTPPQGQAAAPHTAPAPPPGPRPHQG